MNQYEQELCIPGDLIYGNDHAVRTALSRPLRCQTGIWIWPEPPEPLPSEQLRAIDTALLARRGNLYRMPTPDIEEMLRLNQRDPARTYVIDLRPREDAYLLLTWRDQYRWTGPRCRLDLDWLRLMGYSLIVLGAYVEGTLEESEDVA